MDPFTVGIIVLFIMSAIFYVVIFSFIYYWHVVKSSIFVVPALLAFEFFATGFLIISLTSIIIEFLPKLVTAGGL